MKKNRVIKTSFNAFIVMLCLAFSTSLTAKVPQLVQYTGLMTDSNGNPLPDGSYSVAFNLYNSPTGQPGEGVLWTENWDGSDVSHPKVNTQNGRFTVLLGNNTAGGVPTQVFESNDVVFLGVTVESDAEMLPRQRISSVPYALVAGSSVPQGGIIMWSGASVPEGWALCDGTLGTPDLRNRFIVGAGGSYTQGDSGGVDSVDLQHDHSVASHNTNLGGAHQHSVTGSTTGDPSGFNAQPKLRKNSDENWMGHQHSVSGTAWGNGAGINSAHSHFISAVSTNMKLPTNVENRPRYYSLAFIMKL